MISSERTTQDRVVKLFQKDLGYIPLFGGNLQDRYGNSNIEEGPLRMFLTETQGYSDVLATKAISILKAESTNYHRKLYFNNQAVYSLLHYGVDVKATIGKHTDTVWLIDRRRSHHPRQLREKTRYRTICQWYSTRSDRTQKK
jgi:type I restriction enzyme, R subunit